MRIGLVGLGAMGLEHLNGWLLAGCKVVAVCDISQNQLSVMQSYLPNVPYYTSITSMMNDQEIDVVDICTPHHAHWNQLRELLNWNGGLVIEKPVIDQLEQIDMITDLEARNRGFVMRTNKRFEKHIQAFTDHLATYHGSDVEISIKWAHKPEYMANRSWYHGPVSSGGIIMGMGIHYADVLYSCLGDLELISVDASIHNNSPNASDTVVENEAHLCICSVDGTRIQIELLAYENRGTLPMERIEIHAPDAVWTTERMREKQKNELMHEFTFYRSILEQHCIYPPISGLLAVHKLIFECYRQLH